MFIGVGTLVVIVVIVLIIMVQAEHANIGRSLQVANDRLQLSECLRMLV